MTEPIKITLRLENSFFNDTSIPRPEVPFQTNDKTLTFQFEDKTELNNYISKLYAEYIKFNDPETSLIVELLGKIAKQIK